MACGGRFLAIRAHGPAGPIPPYKPQVVLDPHLNLPEPVEIRSPSPSLPIAPTCAHAHAGLQTAPRAAPDTPSSSTGLRGPARRCSSRGAPPAPSTALAGQAKQAAKCQYAQWFGAEEEELHAPCSHPLRLSDAVPRERTFRRVVADDYATETSTSWPMYGPPGGRVVKPSERRELGFSPWWLTQQLVSEDLCGASCESQVETVVAMRIPHECEHHSNNKLTEPEWDRSAKAVAPSICMGALGLRCHAFLLGLLRSSASGQQKKIRDTQELDVLQRSRKQICQVESTENPGGCCWDGVATIDVLRAMRHKAYVVALDVSFSQATINQHNELP
ncbi:hypothetical protein ON010_g10431 [Phytophthora cinnamomi]|nr:hypothetical protein ON010_g10431 [Phytophthora cinnamomi]